MFLFHNRDSSEIWSLTCRFSAGTASRCNRMSFMEAHIGDWSHPPPPPPSRNGPARPSQHWWGLEWGKMFHFRVVLLFPNLQVLVHKHHLSRCHHRLFGRRGKKNDEHLGEVLYLAQRRFPPTNIKSQRALVLFIFHVLLKKKKKSRPSGWNIQKFDASAALQPTGERVCVCVCVRMHSQI